MTTDFQELIAGILLTIATTGSLYVIRKVFPNSKLGLGSNNNNASTSPPHEDDDEDLKDSLVKVALNHIEDLNEHLDDTRRLANKIQAQLQKSRNREKILVARNRLLLSMAKAYRTCYEELLNG